jgi:hypothetical protein
MPGWSNTVSLHGEVGRQDLGCSTAAPASRAAGCGKPAMRRAQHGDAPMHYEVHADGEPHRPCPIRRRSAARDSSTQGAWTASTGSNRRPPRVGVAGLSPNPSGVRRALAPNPRDQDRHRRETARECVTERRGLPSRGCQHQFCIRPASPPHRPRAARHVPGTICAPRNRVKLCRWARGPPREVKPQAA